MQVTGLPYEHQEFFDLGSGLKPDWLGSGLSAWALQSFMGRVNYTFKDRYLLTVSSRVDGSSRLAPATGLTVVVDGADELGPVDHWLGEDLLAALPDDALVIVAGREPPPLAWRVDPGWRLLVRPVPLANLGPAEGAELLTLLGVPASAHPAALRFTHGHPLALALVGDVYAQQGGPFQPSADPQVVTTLLAGLLDAVPGPAHRAALEACAQVRVTTEPLLAALLDRPDAGELFDWLRGLSMMQLGPRGLYPHELARDALVAELRWRHPERYTEIHRRAGRYYQQQFAAADPAGQHTAIADFVYLHRDNEALRPFISVLSPAGSGVAELSAGPVEAGDEARIRALVERYEGPLVLYARHVLGGDAERARDVVQDTFLRLIGQDRALKAIQFGTNIKSVGVPAAADEVAVAQGSVEDRRFVAVYGRHGRIVAAVGFDQAKWLDFYQRLIEAGAPFPPRSRTVDQPAAMQQPVPGPGSLGIDADGPALRKHVEGGVEPLSSARRAAAP